MCIIRLHAVYCRSLYKLNLYYKLSIKLNFLKKGNLTEERFPSEDWKNSSNIRRFKCQIPI